MTVNGNQVLKICFLDVYTMDITQTNQLIVGKVQVNVRAHPYCSKSPFDMDFNYISDISLSTSTFRSLKCSKSTSFVFFPFKDFHILLKYHSTLGKGLMI